MSYRSVAAALALADVNTGERLAAFALASYANRDELAWPSAPAAAVRAGLSRRQYLYSRDALARRGLIAVESRTTGRGHSALIRLTFAETGPQIDHDVNPQLFEAILTHSTTRGSERALQAALAALADHDRVVAGISRDELRAAAGLSDRTYRRARAQLLVRGELSLQFLGGGRAKTNEWCVRDPRTNASAPFAARAARAGSRGSARPLMTTVTTNADDASRSATNGLLDREPTSLDLAGAARRNPGHEQTDSRLENPGHDCTLSTHNPGGNPGYDCTLFAENPSQDCTLSARNPGQDCTLFDETPAKTPAETPAPNARGGRNPRTLNSRKHPPNPPQGGSSRNSVFVEQNYVSDRGRQRRRSVLVDLDEVRRGFQPPTVGDSQDWQRIRERLAKAAGESTFAIWFDPLELIAVDRENTLVVSTAPQACAWLHSRFGSLLASCADGVGRRLRVAEEPERAALTAEPQGLGGPGPTTQVNHQEVS